MGHDAFDRGYFFAQGDFDPVNDSMNGFDGHVVFEAAVIMHINPCCVLPNADVVKIHQCFFLFAKRGKRPFNGLRKFAGAGFASHQFGARRFDVAFHFNISAETIANI